MTDKRKAEEGAMAPWFEAARADAPAPSGDWLARMERLALDEMPSPRPDPVAVSAPAARRGLGARLGRSLRDVLGAVGGWPAMAGLVAACATGVWFGAVPPSGVSDWLSVSAADSVMTLEPTSGFDDVMLGL
ncbi:hypothetical protein [Salipiger thiooxidans]|uniref:hypothetical protein n=1 Tax=Salipiger thiooxidans TaxID=282683 RepID=UPI001CD3AB37|nr:hypothetical protein [Salipiger thiooxidans]MCA0847277.1 hypothetical protein [Salipiger thiooxidans]